MPAPFHDIESKIEVALKTVVETVSLANRGNAAVFTGLSSADLALPYIVCRVDEVTHTRDVPGNYIASAIVEVRSQADDDSLATHRSRVAFVRDALQSDVLAADLSASVLDFHAINAAIISTKHGLDERAFVAEMQLEIYCAPADM